MKKINVFHWRRGRRVQNLGDALAPFIARHYGCTLANEWEILSPHPSALLVGSVLTSRTLLKHSAFGLKPIHVWSCGARGEAPTAWAKNSAIFHAVRGPLTRDLLGLPAKIPLGDCGLLAPKLVGSTSPGSQGRVAIPHFLHEPSRPERASTLAGAECQHLISTRIIFDAADYAYLGSDLSRRPRFLRSDPLGFDNEADAEPREGFLRTLTRIANAEFVLTASLHGAIFAQAFGIPWAAWRLGPQDAPFKWADFGAFLGVSIAQQENARDGERWFTENRRALKRRPTLDDLDGSFPFFPSKRHGLAILPHDQQVSDQSIGGPY